MRFNSRELKVLRVRLGLTQKDVAEKMGWSNVAYNQKENGKMAFSLTDIYKMADVLKMTNNDILTIFFAR